MRAFLFLVAGMGLAVASAAAEAAPQGGTTPPPGVYRLGDAGVTAPVPVKQVRPDYRPSPPAGSYLVTVVEAAVQADGTVRDVTVTKSSGDAAFDQAAMKAAKRWTFKPGKRDGRSVVVRVPLEMTYTRR